MHPQVQRGAALVAVDAQEVGGGARFFVEGRPPGAHVVAVGRLDLDHVGAMVAQPLGAEGPAQNPGQVDYLDAVERAHCHLRRGSPTRDRTSRARAQAAKRAISRA